MLFPVLIALNSLYFLFNLFLFLQWKKIKVNTDIRQTADMFVSVIVVVRNEEENILRLLKDLEAQSYPKGLFEVIVIDDHSEDETFAAVGMFREEHKISLYCERLDQVSSSPKKSGITQALRLAKGEWVLISDGDCRVGEYWIESMAAAFQSSGAKFIFGPVTFVQDNRFFASVLTIEFASLVGAGAASLAAKKPVMCNAANLGFNKRTFYEVGGFEGNEQNASGDDVFLMRKIFEKYPDCVVFNKDKNAVVQTHPENGFKKFAHQRIRWAGKWKRVAGVENRVAPISLFLFHGLWLAALFWLFSGKLSWFQFATLFIIKFSGEYLFLREIVNFLNRKTSLIHYIFASLAYPFYAFFVGIAANISGYTWKGRKYHS